MIVVGGIYRELCRDPSRHDLFGSGTRAAYALSNAPEPPVLRSVANSEDAGLVRALGIDLDIIDRPSSVRFIYDTPISSPVHDYRGSDSPLIELQAEADTILVFGMVDAKPRVRSRHLVIDPQSPHLTDLHDHVHWSAERVAIVGNHREVFRLAAACSPSITEAAESVRRTYDADVIVAKCGPRGAIVVDRFGSSVIEPYATEKVWPIGSGDVFSALFAWYWAVQDKSPREAADIASKGTAYWCSHGATQIVRKDGSIVSAQLKRNQNSMRDVRVYLAGPYFTYGERWLVDLMRAGIKDLGVDVFSPFHDVGSGPPCKVAPADIRGLETCSVVLALLDGLDAGTLFEVGYAKAKGIPVVGFCQQTESSDLTMLIGTDVPMFSSLPEVAYHAIWSALR